MDKGLTDVVAGGGRGVDVTLVKGEGVGEGECNMNMVVLVPYHTSVILPWSHDLLMIHDQPATTNTHLWVM